MEMRKLLLTAFSILLFSSVSAAQTDTPQWELMGGFTSYQAGGEFSSVTSNGGLKNPGQLPGEGFQIGLSRSVKSYFRLTGEVNAVFGKELVAVEHLPAGGEYKTGNEVLAVFAPEATIRNIKRVDFYFHYIVGLAHAVDNQVPAVPNGSQTTWIQGIGFGVDLRTTHRLAVRLLEVDWITSHFPKQDFDAEDDWRFTSGVVFRFGKR
jgi:hypothetical protein